MTEDTFKDISPGALAGGLTIDDIRNGKTYQRNPYMATFATNALHYRGIGSGIVRILAENPNIKLDNDVEGKEFKVIIWRTIQKGEVTTQKDLDTIQKSETTIQKNNFTIQKNDSTIQKGEDTTQKNEDTTQKKLDSSQQKVLNFFSEHPYATIEEAVNTIGSLSLGGVKFVIGKLQQKGLLKRIGGRKHGEWQVITE